MWPILWFLGILVFVLFTFVIAFGAPFLPTLKPQVDVAFDVLQLKRGQRLVELGSGDGRVLIAAAQRGIYSTGYELNPLLFIYSWLRTRKHRKYARVIWGNYWQKQLPKTDAIFVFLLNPYMQKLDNKITQECELPVKLVSFAFQIPGRKPAKQTKGMYLYTYK